MRSSKYIYGDPNNEEEEDLEGNEGKIEEDIVTPYSICNQTNVKLLVKRLSSFSSKADHQSTSKKSQAASSPSTSKSAKSKDTLSVKGGVGSH